MTYRNNDYDGCGHTILGVMFLLDFVGMSIYFFTHAANKYIDNYIYVGGSIAFAFASSLYYIIQTNRYKSKIKDIEAEFKSKEYELKCEVEREKNALKIRNLEIDESWKRIKSIMESKAPFMYSASLYSDMNLYIYDNARHYLRNKKHPAISASEVVLAMKAETKKHISAYKEMLYKYEFLLSTFPELKRYIDDEEALISLSSYDNYSDFDLNRDRASDFLSKEEWMKLSVNERNQLALDRYKKKNKSNWVIGIEYEMYIEYLLRKDGFITIPFGSLKGIEDLGRDIIAKKINNKGEMVTYIIQCKNWSTHKEIHENTICQLFGTTMEYDIQNNQMFQKTVPVLYTTTRLSDIAMEFAKRLGVKVIVTAKGDYPMIKCNINDGNKIYHLPFDQQYYRVHVNKAGEFYAWTVKEAVDAGFRRAYRHIIN